MKTANEITAKKFIDALLALQKKVVSNNAKYFHDEDTAKKFLNVKMSSIFVQAKLFMEMPINEIVKLLDSSYYEARMGAVSIMDFQARDKKCTAERRKELFDIYIKRHDNINNWDLVDRSAPHVVGGYLFNKPKAILYKLAKSKNVNERRTAIVSTYFFIRQNEVEDTFKIAEILINDKEDSINKAVGSWIREAGKKDPFKLLAFLDKHASTMPRVTLRYAVEKLDKKLKEVYMKANNGLISFF